LLGCDPDEEAGLVGEKSASAMMEEDTNGDQRKGFDAEDCMEADG
jgi:hypothetical protein